MAGIEPPTCMIPEYEVFSSVAIAPYRTPGTPEMGKLVADLVDKHNTILMANHGVVAWSHNNVEDAYFKMEILEAYCRTVLGPVEQGEGDYGDELLRSLDAFIEHNGHWEKAANALYCHRHTLRYRIRRVEQLTGRDFSNARDRIEFWLALRGRELVS